MYRNNPSQTQQNRNNSQTAQYRSRATINDNSKSRLLNFTCDVTHSREIAKLLFPVYQNRFLFSMKLLDRASFVINYKQEIMVGLSESIIEFYPRRYLAMISVNYYLRVAFANNCLSQTQRQREQTLSLATYKYIASQGGAFRICLNNPK